MTAFVNESVPEISLVMCTHNPQDKYLSRALAALRDQSLSIHQWELLIVDNLSEPPISTRFNIDWHPRGRVVCEKILGLTPARLRGISETRGELLVFVDDDNVLENNYLEQVVRVAKDYPFLGAWSGQCKGEFEKTPPEWTRRYWGSLCIRQFDQAIWSNLPRHPETMPAGAGLCIRRSVGEHYLQLHKTGSRSLQYDRTGTSLLSGGDNDLAACACALGMGLGLLPQLRLLHLIPPERLTEDYLTRLVEGIAYSSVFLDAEWGKQIFPRTISGTLIDYLRVLRLRSPHRKILRANYRGRDHAARMLNYDR